MIEKFKIANGVSAADMCEAYPIAQKVFSVAITVFIFFNFGSWVASIISEPLYSRWLELSEPFTDAVAKVFPGVDSSTAYLESRGASYLIPAVRNLLSINFALFLFLPLCFAAATRIDLLQNRELVLRSIDSVSKRIPIQIKEIGVRAAIFVLIFFPPLYFGLASDPYITGLGVTIAYYVIAFGVNGVALILVISCVTSLAVLRRGRQAEAAS